MAERPERRQQHGDRSSPRYSSRNTLDASMLGVARAGIQQAAGSRRC